MFPVFTQLICYRIGNSQALASKSDNRQSGIAGSPSDDSKEVGAPLDRRCRRAWPGAL